MASFNYAFQTGIGLNPYILKHVESVVGTENAPNLKIDNLGFLNLLSRQKRTLRVNRPTAPGAIEFVQVAYMQRLVAGQTQTSDTCSNANITPYIEATVPLNIYRQIPIYIEDALIQEYPDDANRVSSLGLPPTNVMNELMNQIKAAANAILEAIDIDLQNQVVFGINPTTGSAASKTINIAKDITQLSLTDGLTEILTEAQQSLFATGNPQIWGSGLFLNFMNQQAAKGLQYNGLNTVIQSNGVDFFYDQNSPSILGTNQIAVASPDSMQLVEFSRFTGPYSGRKGLSDFGSFVLPIQITPTHTIPVEFDYQLRYLDCADAVANVDDYYGNPIQGFRGYQMIISKKCGLFQVPGNAYRASDYLAGSNALLRYTITNI